LKQAGIYLHIIGLMPIKMYFSADLIWSVFCKPNEIDTVLNC